MSLKPSQALVAALFAGLLFVGSTVTAAQPPSLFNASKGNGFLSVDAAFPFSQRLDGDTIVLRWEVAPGYYLYQKRISVKATDPNITPGPLKFARQGIAQEDPYFGTTAVFYREIEAQIPVQLDGPENEARLLVTYQGCAEAGLCYPPETREVLYIAQNRGANIAPEGAAIAPQEAARETR